MEAGPIENLTPLQKLARAAQLMNPVQFDLPRDVACTTPLPGGTCLYDLCLYVFLRAYQCCCIYHTQLSHSVT